jgi:uncharacterized protein YacL
MSQSRFTRPSGPQSNTFQDLPSAQSNSPRETSPRLLLGQDWEFWVIRLALIGLTALLCYNLSPFGFHGLPAAGLGFLVAMVILLAELRMRRAEISGLMGGVLGAVVGLFASLLISLVISRTAEPEPTKSFLEFTTLCALGYLGLVVGSSKGSQLRHIPLPRSVQLPGPNLQALKLLDTSALIDGRIADICETHFLDGALGVPRFVLHELQLVADSSDSLKRQRGRRGLEVLQRMQKMPWLEIRILEEDFPGTSPVDQKLIELARRSGSKIVTNDFNLNKVARVQGVAVLNVNELANAMKPAVLPGESMRVLILREGKEPMQGVAYLDDGTMVVVDGARRFINRTIDIIVTSMHQTPAGKMIFGRLDDRADSSSSRPPGISLSQAEGLPPAIGHGQSHGSPSSRLDSTSPSPYSGREPQ